MSLPITAFGTATGADWQYRLELSGVYTDWVDWSASLSLSKGPANADLQTGVMYWIYARNPYLPGFQSGSVERPLATPFQIMPSGRVVSGLPAAFVLPAETNTNTSTSGYSFAPDGTTTGTGWQYRLGRESVYSTWQNWTQGFEFTTDPAGGNLRTGVLYWVYARNASLDPNELGGINAELAASIELTPDGKVASSTPVGYPGASGTGSFGVETLDTVGGRSPYVTTTTPDLFAAYMQAGDYVKIMGMQAQIAAQKIQPFLTSTVAERTSKMIGCLPLPVPVSTTGNVSMSIAGIRGLSVTASAAPSVIYVTDTNKQGFYGLYSADTTTPDDGAVNIVTASGLRYHYISDGHENVLRWGAKGNASDSSAISNRIAFNAAVAYVSAAANAATDGSSPRNRNRTNTLYVPSGTYHIIGGAINIPGAIRIVGDGGLSYGGSFIYQRSSNINLFDVTGSADGGNCAIQIEDLRLRNHGSGLPTASIINVTESAISANSLYLNRIWFQGGERFFIVVKKTDDLQVTNCTFDGAFNYIFAIGGDTSHKATNVVFFNNTFYAIRGGLGYLGTCDNFQFVLNRVFGSPSLYFQNTNFGIDALSPGLMQTKVNISLNTFDQVENIFSTGSENWTFDNNTVTRTTTPVVRIGGGGQLRYNSICNNKLQGKWVQQAAIYGPDTGLRHSQILGNIIVDEGGSGTAIYLPDSRNHFNRIDNIIDGFSNPVVVSSPGENLINHQVSFSGKYSFSTSGWSVGSFRELIAPGQLINGTIYLAKVIFNLPGIDQAVQVFNIPVSGTFAGSAPASADLSSNDSIYNLSSGRRIRLRLKPGAGTTGLEAAISTSDMAGGSLELTLTTLA